MKEHKFFEYTLPNKLCVLYLPLPDSPSVFISLTGKVGRRVEKDNEIGSAHFLEHLFFDGTTKRPSAFELSKFIEGHGGRRNGSTGAELVKYWVKIISQNVEQGFEYLSDIFFNSLLEEIDKEKKVITQEVKLRKDNPADQIKRLAKTTLFPNQAVGRSLFDELPHIPNMTKEMLINYYNRVYTSNNFVLTIAGNINKEDALAMAAKYFGQFKDGEEILFNQAKPEEKETVNIVNGDFKQSKIRISYRGYAMGSDEELYARLLNIVLGEGTSSRLNNRIRNDLHLAYSAGSRVSFASDYGYHSIYTSVDEDNVQKTLDEMFSVIVTLLKDGITDEELEKAKNKLIAGMMFDFENIDHYANFYTHQLILTGKIEDMKQQVEKIKSASKEDLMKVAKYVFSDKPKVNILTNFLKQVELNN